MTQQQLNWKEFWVCVFQHPWANLGQTRQHSLPGAEVSGALGCVLRTGLHNPGRAACMVGTLSILVTLVTYDSRHVVLAVVDEGLDLLQLCDEVRV